MFILKLIKIMRNKFLHAKYVSMYFKQVKVKYLNYYNQF